VGTDLSAVITWVGLRLCTAEPHALEFMCKCHLDLARVTQFRSIERFRTQDTGHCTTIMLVTVARIGTLIVTHYPQFPTVNRHRIGHVV
jgi:hypothetical protein